MPTTSTSLKDLNVRVLVVAGVGQLSDSGRGVAAGGVCSGGRGRAVPAAVPAAGDEFELEPAGAVVAAAAAEDGHEGVAELLGHGAVEHEVDRVVDERHGIQQVPKRVVHHGPEAVDEDGHERDDALWQLGDGEEHHHGQQHARGAVVLAVLVRLGLAALGLEQHALAVGLVHGMDQQDGQRGQHEAGQQFDQDRLDPVVHLGKTRTKKKKS